MAVSSAAFFLNWDEAVQAGADAAGGKGWGLGRLAQYGFNIPRGGVLTTRAYEEFINYNGLQDLVNTISSLVSGENLDETSNQDRLKQLRRKIIEGTLPPLMAEELKTELGRLGILAGPLAVRSSAAAEDSAKASFAGIHDSFLNVRGAEVMEAVKGCYASLWSDRAVAYRRKLQIRDEEVMMGVVVLEMVEALAAGIGFTCDPQTGRQDRVVINANFGLGEATVAGAAEPDTYYLDTSPWNSLPELVERKTGRKEGMTCLNPAGGTQFVKTPDSSGRQVLSDPDIARLGLLLLRVFEALGDCDRHQDVEWVFDGRDFILVQSRPVTALPRTTFASLRNQPDIWSNGNYRDAVPMVLSPLIRRLTIATIDRILKSNYTETGYALPEGLQFSRFFNGRLYCNLSALQWAMYDAMGALPRDFNIGWGGHQPEIELKDPKPFAGMKGLQRLYRGIRGVRLIKRAVKKASQTHARAVRSLESLIENGFSHLEDKDLIQRYHELGRISLAFTGEFSFLSGAASLPVGGLMRILAKSFGPRAATLLNALMVGSAVGITSADHGYRLVELAEIARRDKEAAQYLGSPSFDPRAWQGLPEDSAFKQAFREFIREYGHRAVYELDIINPRWKEDPAYLLDIIRSTMATADLRQLKARQIETFEQAWQEMKTMVPARKHSSIEKLIRKAQEGAALREKTKSVLAVIMEAYREIAQELGFRFCRRGIIEEQADIYFCTWPEVVALLRSEWDGTGLKALVADRKVYMKEMESIAPPDVIMGDAPKYTEPAVRSAGNFLTGVPVAAGKASGMARLIRHPAEGNRLQPGDVLVAPSTDPGWTPLFLKAGAVVMETGGFLSHGAIVAREYGIPAVVNIAGVLGVIREGQLVEVDGDEGKVFLKD